MAILFQWNAMVCDDVWLIGLLSTIFIAGHTAGSMVIVLSFLGVMLWFPYSVVNVGSLTGSAHFK